MLWDADKLIMHIVNAYAWDDGAEKAKGTVSLMTSLNPSYLFFPSSGFNVIWNKNKPPIFDKMFLFGYLLLQPNQILYWSKLLMFINSIL